MRLAVFVGAPRGFDLVRLLVGQAPPGWVRPQTAGSAWQVAPQSGVSSRSP